MGSIGMKNSSLQPDSLEKEEAGTTYSGRWLFPSSAHKLWRRCMKVTDISAGYSLPRIFLIVVNMHTIKFTVLPIVKFSDKNIHTVV